MSKQKRSYLITTHKKLSSEYISCVCKDNCQKHNPKNTSKGSHRYFIWECKIKHRYKARVNSRTSSTKPTNCAQCSKASIPNSKEKLITKYPDLYLILDKCLNHGSCDKSLLTTGSNCTYKIICKKGHSYITTIYNATRTKICFHLCQINSLAENYYGAKFIKCLCKSCSIKKIHNENNLSHKSTKLALWECKNCQKQFKSKIKDRTSSDNIYNCPLCIPTATSIREQSIISELSNLLGLSYTGTNYVPGWRYPVDFFSDSDKIVIQYDSYYYHKDKIKSDKNCNKIINNLGYNIIRIREKPLLATSKSDIFITKKDTAKEIANTVYKIIKQQ